MLICASALFKIRPLKDVWAQNVALLAARSPLITATCKYSELPDHHKLMKTSKLIRIHRDAAAILWRGAHSTENDSLNVIPNPTSSNLYHKLVADVYLDETFDHLSNRLTDNAMRHLTPLPSANNIINNIKLARPFPQRIFYHHMLLCLNALPTAARTRWFNGMTDVKCHFCNQGADSIIHIYTQCTVVAAARCQFFCLSTKHQCTVPHPHLEQNINQCEISDFPFTHTLLSSTPSHLISPTLAFNMAVWNFRLPASASKFERSPEWIISKIVSIGCLISSPPKKTEHKSSHPCSHENIVKGLSADSIVCYTDGSASPNPGPCGAGILIFDLANQMRYEGGLSLGMGTNNIGELAALGGVGEKGGF